MLKELTFDFFLSLQSSITSSVNLHDLRLLKSDFENFEVTNYCKSSYFLLSPSCKADFK